MPHLQGAVVSDDSVVDDDKLAGRSGRLRVRVDGAGTAVGCPARVGNAGVNVELNAPIGAAAAQLQGHMFLELRYLPTALQDERRGGGGAMGAPIAATGGIARLRIDGNSCDTGRGVGVLLAGQGPVADEAEGRTPALSYPRYSRRRSPVSRHSTISFLLFLTRQL